MATRNARRCVGLESFIKYGTGTGWPVAHLYTWRVRKKGPRLVVHRLRGYAVNELLY